LQGPTTDKQDLKSYSLTSIYLLELQIPFICPRDYKSRGAAEI
jgi:hypothetical protein